MSPKEVDPPKGRHYKGKNKVYSSVARQWTALCQAKPGPMYTCYVELADNPFPPGRLDRRHQLKGKLRGTWQYEVGGGERVWYKRGENGERAPSETGEQSQTRINTGISKLANKLANILL